MTELFSITTTSSGSCFLVPSCESVSQPCASILLSPYTFIAIAVAFRFSAERIQLTAPPKGGPRRIPSPLNECGSEIGAQCKNMSTLPARDLLQAPRPGASRLKPSPLWNTQATTLSSLTPLICQKTPRGLLQVSDYKSYQ